ncbi:flippase [Fodinibius sp. AD559]|uniref:flippase n=1 Tax=Fodinibius sp. AD559 TaxID=3424179 RepID=UPI004046D200
MSSEIGKKLARNFTVMFGAQSITWISSFVLLMFLPRYLGSADYGRLYLALSIKMMLGLLIDFGGNYLIPKEVARSKEVGARIFSSYILLRIVLWVFSLGVILLITQLLGYSEQVNILIWVLAISMLWEGGTKALKSYFQGVERMEYPAIGTIVERTFVAIFAIIALLMGVDSIGIAVIMTFGALVHLLVLFSYSKKFITLKYKMDTKVFSLMRSGMPYFLFSLFSVIYYRVDAVMLSSMTTEAVTGWYGGAYRFFDMVMMLPLLYKTAVFPVFSKLWDDKEGRLETTISKSIKFIIILGIPVSILIYIYAQDIVQFFMGLEEFGPSVIILQIFSISITFIYVDLIIGSAILGAANRQKEWAVVGFLAIFLNVGANYLMIPYAQAAFANGGIGAAIATFITELFMLGSALYLLPKGYLSKFKLAYVVKPALSGGLMVAFLWFVNGTGLYWMLTALSGGAVYLAALFAFKLFDEQELKLIKSFSSLSGIKMILTNKKA